MNLLIVDNNILPSCWGAADLVRTAREAGATSIMVRRAPERDLPQNPRAFDRIIVSGSITAANDEGAWIEDLLTWIRRTLEARVPYLGVCYGHQMLVRALQGQKSVRRGPRGEFGWTRIEKTTPSRLLKNVSDAFYSFSSHFDEVSDLPSDFTPTAKSEHCDIQAIESKTLPAFGIQFHPEKNAAEAKTSISEALKSPKKKKLVTHPKDSDKLYDSKLGVTLFKNFFEATTG